MQIHHVDEMKKDKVYLMALIIKIFFRIFRNITKD
jgi:hypothetical protein